MRLPVLPTLFVAAAVAVMIGLGFWQLERMEWKEALIAEMEAVKTAPPVDLADVYFTEGLHLRRTTIGCSVGQEEVLRIGPGQSAQGRAGYLYYVDCLEGVAVLDHGPPVWVVAGWSSNPKLLKELEINHPISGVLKEAKNSGYSTRYTLVADKAVPPLERAMQPTPAAVPNNHLFYAMQWFFFAAAAAVIYLLALRRRQRAA